MTPRKSKSARAAKIARVWCLARDLGYSDTVLHIAVESITGSDSIAALSMQQLNEVIYHLLKQLKKQKVAGYRKNTQQSRDGVAFMPTPDQRDHVITLLRQITPVLKLYNPNGYLQAICKKTFRKEYEKLNRKQVQNLIEALKSIYKRAQTVK